MSLAVPRFYAFIVTPPLKNWAPPMDFCRFLPYHIVLTFPHAGSSERQIGQGKWEVPAAEGASAPVVTMPADAGSSSQPKEIGP